MGARELAVVTAGLSQPSSTRLLADRLTEAVGAALGDDGIVTNVRLVDLREYAQDLAGHLVTGFSGERLRAATDSVVTADGLVAVTPVFSASYSGLFKSFFDVVEDDALENMPVLIAATGGTARHSLALEFAVRPLFAYFRATVVPTAVFAASEDWGGGDEEAGGHHRGLAERIDRAGRELANLMAASAPRAVTDPFSEPTPFEQLLSDN